MIHITNGQNDNIVGFLTEKDITFNEQTRNIETYQDTFEFIAFGSHKYAKYLTDMNRIIVPEEDGGYSEYVINAARKRRDSSNQVRVKSFGSYLLLTVAKAIRPTSLLSYTPTQTLSFITNNTEWRPGVVESNATRTFHIENYTDPFSFLKTVSNEFDLEINFRIETDGKRVTGRFIDLVQQVGEWRGREITFGKDLDAIERTEDLSNVVTKLVCIGPEDEEGTRLEIEVADEDALQRWGRPDPVTGELMHLVAIYEPTSERTDMTETELEQYGRTELNKRINASVVYGAEVVDLENVPGMENKKIRFGDTVRVKDEKFNPPLYVEARIFEQRRDIFTKSNKRVKLGDFTEYTEEDLRAVIDMLTKQVRAKISAAEMIEYTYKKDEIDNKDTQVKADAEQDATQKAQQAISVSKDHADQVASDAESNANNYTNTVKSQIDAELLDKAGLEYVDGQLVLKANQSQVDTIETELNGAILDIADKADISYVDGQLVLKANQSQVDGLVQDIADKADLTYVNGQLTSKADKADTYTITQVDNALNSKVSTTQYTTDINGIVTDLNDHESRITQTETDITSKVSSTQYNQDISAIQGDISTLETTVGNHTTSINQNASAISLKANATDVYTKTQVDTSLSNKADTTTVNAIETRVSEAEAELTVQAGQIASKVSQTEYDADINGVVTRLNSAESSITQNANEITQRVTTTTYNAGMASKEGTVYKQSSAPAHANGRLWLNTSVTPNILYRSTGSTWVKATPTTASEVGAYSSSAGTSLANRVTTAESNITQNANAITLKAEQSALDSLEGDVTQISSDVSSLQVGVNGITADVSSLESTVNGHTSDISSLNSQVNILAGQISSKVDATYVTGAIADIEVGGRNYIPNSKVERGFGGFAIFLSLSEDKHELSGSNAIVSFEARHREDSDPYVLHAYYRTGSGGNLGYSYGDRKETTTEYQRFIIPIDTDKIPNNMDDYVTLIIRKPSNGGYIYVRNIKLEKGNKATDWTPAPEDVQSEIDSVYSYAESEITQMAGQISLKADSTTVNNINTRLSTAEIDINALDGAITSKVETSTFNTLKGRVDTAETTISQQADEIDLKVNKNGVIGAINLSSEVASINASKINLVGAVTVLSSITGNLGTINAGTINGVNINGSAFNQTGANGSITLDNNGLIFDGANSSIEMNIITASGWEDVASLVFKDNNGSRAMEIYQHYTDSVVRSDRSLHLISGDQGLYLDGTAYRNAFNSPGVFADGGLKVINDRQSLIVESKSTATNAYDPVNIVTPYASTQIGPRNSEYSHFKTNTSNGFYFYDPVTIANDLNANTDVVARGEYRGAVNTSNPIRWLGGGSISYLQTRSTEYRITDYMSGTLKPIRASSFPVGSSIEYKDNIKNLSSYDAERILDNCDIFSYHLKSDLEMRIYDKIKIGALSEMMPKEIRDENGADVYSMVSVLWKIAKDQKNKVIQLEQRISDLEMFV